MRKQSALPILYNIQGTLRRLKEAALELHEMELAAITKADSAYHRNFCENSQLMRQFYV